MNNILKLNGKFYKKSNSSKPGPANIPVGKVVSCEAMESLSYSLDYVLNYWKSQELGFKPLVAVHYKMTAAKSNRISAFFSRSASANSSVVGAKFTDSKQPKHIITHCLTINEIENTLDILDRCTAIVKSQFDGQIDHSTIKKITDGKIKLIDRTISKSTFSRILKDCYYVSRFGIPSEDVKRSIEDAQIISLYDTGLNFSEIVRILKFTNPHFDRLDDTTWLLTPDQYKELFEKAPDLISMAVSDFSSVPSITCKDSTLCDITIPHPTTEPVIGVIDTQFDTSAYFSEWVEYHNMIPNIPLENEDFYHGTAVDSIIVDGPSLNPILEDGCGRFRVRHFGVAKDGKNSALAIIKQINNIVVENKDIKVWNLSLGSEMETSINSISPEAALLDKLQYENDVIFIIAGTNNNNRKKSFPRIGAPADSINSLVVNSITMSNKPAEYSRTGPVLCFFTKPDVSAFGGDSEDYMQVFTSKGLRKEQGTSFAAPWIARKVAYLIHYMKFSREIAKSLIIDAAIGWNTDTQYQNIQGFGRVPYRIEDILKTPDDEIKFLLQGISDKYETYAYNIPLPAKKDVYPYIAKATLCYFPNCSRKQGVDYTNTELDIHFGRLHEGHIKSIDNNMQGDSELVQLYEETARKLYRKWDNVKHIAEGNHANTRGRKVYEDSKYWGVSIKSKSRLDSKVEEGLHFGVVITLKEIDGKNRIEDFIRLCNANNWFVQEIDAENMIENYAIEEETITFED